MVLSLVTLRQSGRKIFIRQHCLVQKSAVDLDLSNSDLKIHNELLLSRGNHCKTLANFKQKVEKILSGQHLVYRPSEQLRDATSFLKGAKKR